MDAIEISGRTRGTFALSTSVANSGVIEKGVYDIWADVAASIATERQTPSPALTLANGYPLTANVMVRVRVGMSQAIYGIAGGAGNLYYMRVSN